MKVCLFTSGVFPVRKDTVKAIEHWSFELAEKLTASGHEVHLFAAFDSSGNFILHTPRGGSNPFRELENKSNYYVYLVDFFCQCIKFATENGISVIHDQTSAPFLVPLTKSSPVPVVSTIHVLRRSPDLTAIYEQNKLSYNISPSHYLAENNLGLKTDEVIYHGVDTNNFQFNPCPAADLVSIGRIYPGKGQLKAVEVANLAKTKLKLAGYAIPNEASEKYFDDTLKAIDKSDFVSFVGKVGRDEVSSFLSQATALLMPIQEGEAFGLVMIEAMATGTPVIAYDIGPVKEIVKDGKTGFVVPLNDLSAMAEAIRSIGKIKREDCRSHVEENFSHSKMVDLYEKAYLRAIEKWKTITKK